MPDIQIKRGTRSAFTSLKSGSGLIVGQPYYITDENVLAIADTTSTASEYGVSDNFPISKLNIDGGTDIGAALVDADLMIVDDGANGTNRKSAMSRLWTYISGKMTGAISGLLTSNLTANRALGSDGNGKVIVLDTATYPNLTELAYVKGGISNFQTQITALQLSGVKVKSSDTSITTYGLVSDSDLQFAGMADTKYLVNLDLLWNIENGYASGSLLKFTAPSGATAVLLYDIKGDLYSNSQTVYASYNSARTYNTNVLSEVAIYPGSSSASNRITWYNIKVLITLSATSGNVVFNWGKGVDNGYYNTLKAGSSLTYSKVV